MTLVRPYAAHVTNREMEVLGLLVEGLPNKEIGYRLGLEAHTVKGYIFRVCRRFGVTSRFKLALILQGMDQEDWTLP